MALRGGWGPAGGLGQGGGGQKPGQQVNVPERTGAHANTAARSDGMCGVAGRRSGAGRAALRVNGEEMGDGEGAGALGTAEHPHQV